MGSIENSSWPGKGVMTNLDLIEVEYDSNETNLSLMSLIVSNLEFNLDLIRNNLFKYLKFI